MKGKHENWQQHRNKQIIKKDKKTNTEASYTNLFIGNTDIMHGNL